LIEEEEEFTIYIKRDQYAPISPPLAPSHPIYEEKEGKLSPILILSFLGP
jgi:hypothetical protein